MVGMLLSYWVSACFQGLWLLVSGSVDVPKKDLLTLLS